MKITSKEKKEIREIRTMAKNYSQNDDKTLWETLITGIVRPPRADYRDTQLGTKSVTQERKILHTMTFSSLELRTKCCMKERKYS